MNNDIKFASKINNISTSLDISDLFTNYRKTSNLFEYNSSSQKIVIKI